MDRDYQLVERLSKLGDDVMVGVNEVAALCGLSPVTVQQRRTKMLPPPIDGSKPLKWRLGDLRDRMRGGEPAARRITGRNKNKATA